MCFYHRPPFINIVHSAISAGMYFIKYDKREFTDAEMLSKELAASSRTLKAVDKQVAPNEM